MPLGDINTILGKEWLTEHDPDISWRTMEIHFREEQGRVAGEAIDDTPIPPEYADFADVFDAEKFKELPPHRNHDCAINFKEGTNYPDLPNLIPCLPTKLNNYRNSWSKNYEMGKSDQANRR